MAVRRVQKKTDWTPDDRARRQAIRDTFQDEPTIDQLVARGELCESSLTLESYINLRLLVSHLRELREQSQLSLADLSERSGMDKAMLSRLETGRVPNPGIETITRYLAALKKSIEWRVVDAPA